MDSEKILKNVAQHIKNSSYLDQNLSNIDVENINSSVKIKIKDNNNESKWLNINVKTNKELKNLISKLTGLK